MHDGMRVAVVGGGIFGVTAAIHLARAGHRVVLFEQAPDLLLAASNVNQRRLHRGYHYPRSPATVRSVQRALASFVDEYADTVVHGQEHYVAIAREDSLIDAERYLELCRATGLPYREGRPWFLRPEAVQLSLRVEEQAVDIDALRALCWRRLRHHGVTVRLRTRRTAPQLADYDHVVLCTYAALNAAQAGRARRYQFEVCEKPVLRLPAAYGRTSVVVLDGPFMCIDPMAGTDAYLAGNVRHGIHATTVGLHPLTPRHLRHAIDNGVHRSPPRSRFAAFVADGTRFFRDFERAEHLGSMFTIRAVLPDLERTDARPTLVRRLDNRTTSIFSGKIVTCVEAARRVVAAVERDGRLVGRV